MAEEEEEAALATRAPDGAVIVGPAASVRSGGADIAL